MEADIYVQADKQKRLTAGTRRPPLSALRRFKERMLKMSPENPANIETLAFLNNATQLSLKDYIDPATETILTYLSLKPDSSLKSALFSLLPSPDAAPERPYFPPTLHCWHFLFYYQASGLTLFRVIISPRCIIYVLF